MAAPLPSDYQALVTDPSAQLCERFKTLIESLPPELFNLVNFMFTEDGGLTSEFSALIQKYANTDPIGSIKMYAGNALPDGGFLWCDGSDYQKDEKQDLFGVIGYTFTPGYTPGQASFKVPNLNGKFVVGADGTVVVPGNVTENDFSVLTNAIFGHYHVIGYKNDDGSGTVGAFLGSNGIDSPSGEATVLMPSGVYENFRTTNYDEEKTIAEDVDLEPGLNQAERLQTSAPWEDSGRILSDTSDFLPPRVALRFIIKE